MFGECFFLNLLRYRRIGAILPFFRDCLADPSGDQKEEKKNWIRIRSDEKAVSKFFLLIILYKKFKIVDIFHFLKTLAYRN